MPGGCGIIASFSALERDMPVDKNRTCVETIVKFCSQKVLISILIHREGGAWYTQEFITGRVHMVSTPAIWIGWRRQSAVNMLSCENTAVKRRAFATQLMCMHLEWLHVEYLLSKFTADCLRPDDGYRSHMGVAHSSCYKLLVQLSCLWAWPEMMSK